MRDEVGFLVEVDLRAELLGQDDPPRLVDRGLLREAVEQPLEHPPLHGAAGQIADLGIHLGRRLHRVAFEVGAAVVAVDDHEFGGFAFGPGGIAGFEDAAEVGRDGDPPLPVHLLVELASEPPNHCPAVPFPVARNDNGGSGCCHCPIRRPRPIAGYARLRAPPGGMSARSRAGSLRSGEAGCLYETCSWGVWSLALRFVPFTVIQGCHGKSW